MQRQGRYSAANAANGPQHNLVEDVVCRWEKGRREQQRPSSWIWPSSWMQNIAQPPQKSSAECGR